MRYTFSMTFLRGGLLLALLVVFTAMFSAAPAALAQGTKPFEQGLKDAQTTASGGGLSTKTNVIEVIANIIKFLLALSAVLAMGAIVWGGITYITSLGNENKAEHAKDIIKYAIYGVIVILISYVIIAFLQAQLTAENPWGVSTAYAQSGGSSSSGSSGAAGADTSRGFNSGLDAITRFINPRASGLADDPNLIAVILRLVNFLLSLIAVLALFALVWGAVMYILALGDENKTEKAKNIIKGAIIGVLLAGVSFLIIRVLQSFLASP